MNPFDNDLRRLLGRREPPRGFAERVLARARDLDRPRQPAFDWRWAAAAAAVVMLTAGSYLYQDHRRRVEGEWAKEQALLALRVTGSKLRSAQQQVLELQRRSIELPER